MRHLDMPKWETGKFAYFHFLTSTTGRKEKGLEWVLSKQLSVCIIGIFGADSSFINL